MLISGKVSTAWETSDLITNHSVLHSPSVVQDRKETEKKWSKMIQVMMNQRYSIFWELRQIVVVIVTYGELSPSYENRCSEHRSTDTSTPCLYLCCTGAYGMSLFNVRMNIDFFRIPAQVKKMQMTRFRMKTIVRYVKKEVKNWSAVIHALWSSIKIAMTPL